MTWDDAILDVMAARRGANWTLTELYAKIAPLPIVTPHHRELWGSQPNYHHWVRSALTRLKKQGRVKWVAPATCRLV